MTPEFVSRIYIAWLAWVWEGRKHRRAFQGASGVFGLTSLPERRGKLDNDSPSVILNFSMSKISGTTWELGTYFRVSVGWDASSGSGGLTAHDKRRLVDDTSWYSLWLRTVGSLGLMR